MNITGKSQRRLLSQLSRFSSRYLRNDQLNNVSLQNCCVGRKHLVTNWREFANYSENFGEDRTREDSYKVLSPPRNASSIDTNQLLDKAVAASHQIYDRTTLSSAVNTALQTTASDLDILEVLTKKMKNLEEAADGLLSATKVTIPLAQMIKDSANDDRVLALHRTFLSIILKCVTVLNEVSKFTDDEMEATSLFSSSLLDKTLRLAVRARQDLGLPLHLPLYQSLAVSIAQSSHCKGSSAKWIVQTGKWAHEDFLSKVENDFFLRPLCELAEQKQYGEIVNVLLPILHTQDFSLEYLDERALKQFIPLLYEDFRLHVWEVPQRKHLRRTKPHQKSLLMEEILLLLEPSIWKVFGYSSAIPEQESSLRDAIDVLITPTSGVNLNTSRTNSDSLDGKSIEEDRDLFNAFFPGQIPDDTIGNEMSNFLEDLQDSGLTHDSLEFHVEMDSDLTIVGVTRVFPEDDEKYHNKDEDNKVDDNDDNWSIEVPSENDWFHSETIPDIVEQFEKASGKKLQYSKSFKRHLVNQLGPMSR